MNPELSPDTLYKNYSKFVYNNMRYETTNGVFVNKCNAADSVGGDLNQIQFKVDDAWTDVDFSKKPKKEYFELVKQRASHIRSNYEYVRFWLSGGLDSYTALWGFIESGAHIDEIVVMNKYLFSPTELNNFEEHTICQQIIDHFKHTLSKTKITLINYDWNHFDKVYESDFPWMNWVFGSAVIEIRAGISVSNPFFQHNHLLDLFNENIKVADVYGLEKSFVKQINDQWFHVMLDNKLSVGLGRPGFVGFFCDPTFPDLYVLDAHAKLETGKSPRLPHPFYNPTVHKYINKYHDVKRFSSSNKSVIMEVEASLLPKAANLVEKFYTSMEQITKKYPTLIPSNWVVTQGPVGHFGLASSLSKNHNCMYHEI